MSTNKEPTAQQLDDPFAHLKSEGQSLGYEGKELTSYVQERAREERAAARERDKEQRDREREKEQRDHELEKIEREKEREMALEMKRIEQELEQKRLENEREIRLAELGRHETPHQGVGNGNFKPKLPPFNEQHDSIDSYLFRFEKYAESVGWNEDQCLNFLPAFLKGKALSAYHEIAEDTEFSYHMLKCHLLKRFDCSEEGFRNKFRSARPEQGVPMTVYLNQLKHSFGRWIDLKETKQNYESVVDLVLREQFLSGCSSCLWS